VRWVTVAADVPFPVERNAQNAVIFENPTPG
jgi:hypothetical protein